MTRILLVEDDPDVRPLLEHILLSEDYQVATADSVAIAVSLLEAQPFDLVLCDVNLPDGSGLSIADKARAAGVKALVVTGHGLSLKPGSLARYDYLLKPLRVAELTATIKRCLAEKDDESEVVFEVIRFPKTPT
jgi:two-component system response regulator PilR (NtrC family)